ncbi:130_t:CDS:2, partial [Acaulospora colombiana]
KMQLLQVCKDGTFRWYPAKKYYMFTKLPTWRVPNAEEANDRFEKDQRRRNPLYFAENLGPNSDFSRAFRQHARLIEMEDRKVNLGGGFGAESSMPAGGRALRDEDDDMGDDDVKRALQQEKQERDQEIFGMEGDMDEMEYEEDVADDDEKVHADGKEDEDREIE